MFNVNFKLLIISELFILYNSSTVQCYCEINVARDSKVIPLFEKQIGKTKLEVNTTNGQIQIGNGGELIGFCETYFRPLSELMFSYDVSFSKSRQFIELSCREDRLFFMHIPVAIPIFECAELNWQIVYESNDHISLCDPLNATNLFLSSRVNDYEKILAAMCFDLKAVSLRFINYNVQYSQSTDAEMLNYMKSNASLGYVPLLEDLQLLKTTKSVAITNELLQQTLKDSDELNPLLSLVNLEVSSIVQGHSYAKYFKEYNDFLNIIWCRNLRLGNWKLFINTLENYARSNKFQMFTGTSGLLELPVNLTHKQSKKLELKIDSKTLTIPEYIWSYVLSIDGSNEDFVIVGYNSPYAEFFSLDDIIFCPDICAEIPWLKDIHTSFRYSFAGIMFCCSTDFVRNTNPLDGFPITIFDAMFESLL